MVRLQDQGKREEENRQGNACRQYNQTHRGKSLLHAGCGVGQGQKAKADRGCPSPLSLCYGIGDKALDISEAYGVSIGYSDLKDLPAGYHLRYLYTGKDVEAPE